MRVSGVIIPDEKRIDIALTYLYGVGRSNVRAILEKANIDGAKRANSLTEDEIKEITNILDKYKVEGDLRAEVNGNIRRQKEIGSYIGMRHSKGLPVRGQRTRSNARTKRGKRMTIGAVKKEVVAKVEAAQKSKEVAK